MVDGATLASDPRHKSRNRPALSASALGAGGGVGQVKSVKRGADHFPGEGGAVVFKPAYHPHASLRAIIGVSA